jgi:hypothetical protein
VERALGVQYADDAGDWYLRRDYGLAEFTFIYDNDMRCGFVIVDVHRLLSLGSEIVPAVLTSLYGELSGHLNADLILGKLAAAGVESRLDTYDDATAESRYVVPATGCLIHVEGDGDRDDSGDDWPKPGEILKISIHDQSADWWRSQYA